MHGFSEGGTVRNFEADRLVRIGDVMDFLEKYTENDENSHEVDLGDFGYETITCDSVVNLDDVAAGLLKRAVEDA